MSEGTVHKRMAAATSDLSYIPKGRSKGVSYEFRGIDALMNHLHPVLSKHGLFLSPRVLDDWQVNLIPGSPDSKGNPRQQSQALFRVCVDVYAEDGSTVTLGPGLAQSHDYGDKAVYQAQQNAVKYVLLEAFCIPTEEQDMDAREADPVPAKRQHSKTPDARSTIRERIKAAGLVDAFVAFLAETYDTNRLDDLDDGQVAKVLAATSSEEGLATIAEFAEAETGGGS